MKNISFRKIGLFLLLFILSYPAATAQENSNIEITVLSTESFKDDGKRIYYPENKRDVLVEVHAKIRNNSKVDLDLNNIFLEGNGEVRRPMAILAKSRFNPFKRNIERIKANRSKKRRIIYSFPGFIHPTSLLIDNDCRIPLRSQNYAENISYFDVKWNKIPSKENAVYYRLSSKSGNQWIVRDYFTSNGQLQMESEYSSLSPEIRNGYSTWYYENGNISEEGAYKDNKKTGIFFKYYETGGRKSKTEFSGKRQKLLQYWSENGDALLTSGSGRIRHVHNEGGNVSSIITDYEDYSIVQSMELRKLQADTVYSYIETVPSYPGGMERLYRFINQGVTYPEEARRNGTEGRVYIRFIVDKFGNPVEVETIKGIGSGCDKESERIIKVAGSWNPGKVDGKPVKVRMILPITFKLN